MAKQELGKACKQCGKGKIRKNNPNNGFLFCINCNENFGANDEVTART